MKKPVITARSVCELTPAWLREQGVSAVLADLDNTLAGYSGMHPDEQIAAWIKSLAEAGIHLAIVSNGSEQRVAGFCVPLAIPYVARSGKPRADALLKTLDTLGVPAEQALMVGDQYFTDIKAGQKAGLRTVLVDPLVGGFLFSLRRLIEMPFIRRLRVSL